MDKIPFLKRVSYIGEKNLLSRLSSFLEIADEVSDYLIQMIQGVPDSLNVLNEKIRAKEKEADVLSEDFSTSITRGAINPSLINNLLFLISKLDDVIDRTYFLSREIRRLNLYYLQDNSNSSEALKSSYEMFVRMLNSGKEALRNVNFMLSESDMSKIDGYRKRIEIVEETVDEMKDTVLDDTYKNADKMTHLLFAHITGLAHKIDDMVDDCEDAADIILSTYKSLTG